MRSRVAGATASASAADQESRHPQHLLGNALRAVRVMASAAFEVVVLGRIDEDPGRAGR